MDLGRVDVLLAVSRECLYYIGPGAVGGVMPPVRSTYGTRFAIRHESIGPFRGDYTCGRLDGYLVAGIQQAPHRFFLFIVIVSIDAELWERSPAVHACPRSRRVPWPVPSRCVRLPERRGPQGAATARATTMARPFSPRVLPNAAYTERLFVASRGAFMGREGAPGHAPCLCRRVAKATRNVGVFW